MTQSETKSIKDYLTTQNMEYFESTSEPSSVAWEQYIKLHKKVSYIGFVRIYNSQFSKFSKIKRMCYIPSLKKGVYFSFKKNGNVYVAGDSFIHPGKSEYVFSFHYYGKINGINFHGHIKYRLSRVQSRLVYLHDLKINASTKMNQRKVIYK